MTQFFQIHPENPQPRLIAQAAAIVRSGGVIVYPTDSCYAIGCHVGDKAAVERIRRIRKLSAQHNFTLICRDLSELSVYAKVNNPAYRLIRNLTPGPYTFILPATNEVPRRLLNPKRKTIGLRLPGHNIAQALLESLGEPLMSTSMILPGDEFASGNPFEIRNSVGTQVDLIIDGGHCGIEPTTIIDLTTDQPQVIREGKGDISLFEHG
ncbi:MAG: L-threonylcarbamoyladenylate synthase [Gammaproteobacteria bacterium]|nr:L-threonylcarbamoyladenylate synthase [Gammaproteobacteria bacterium]MDH5693495.1 L-threonylcarbamoyladenylate synthase [Gammaproteobacteria bacterium]